MSLQLTQPLALAGVKSHSSVETSSSVYWYSLTGIQTTDDAVLTTFSLGGVTPGLPARSVHVKHSHLAHQPAVQAGDGVVSGHGVGMAQFVKMIDALVTPLQLEMVSLVTVQLDWLISPCGHHMIPLTQSDPVPVIQTLKYTNPLI